MIMGRKSHVHQGIQNRSSALQERLESGERRLERVTVLGLAKLLESQGGSRGAQG